MRRTIAISGSRQGFFIFHLYDFYSGSAGAADTIGSPPPSRKGYDQIGPAFIDHALVAEWAGGASVFSPVCREAEVWNTEHLSPF